MYAIVYIMYSNININKDSMSFILIIKLLYILIAVKNMIINLIGTHYCHIITADGMLKC